MNKEDLRLVLALSKTIKDFDKEMIYLIRNLIELHLEDLEEYTETNKTFKQIIKNNVKTTSKQVIEKNHKLGAPIKNRNSAYMIKKYGKIKEPFENEDGSIKRLD